MTPEEKRSILCPNIEHMFYIRIDFITLERTVGRHILYRKGRPWGGQQNRVSTKRVRFGKEEQQNERALTFYKKVGANDMTVCSGLVEEGGFEPPKLTQQIYSLPPLATRELLHMKLELVDGFEPPTC